MDRILWLIWFFLTLSWCRFIGYCNRYNQQKWLLGRWKYALFNCLLIASFFSFNLVNSVGGGGCIISYFFRVSSKRRVWEEYFYNVYVRCMLFDFKYCIFIPDLSVSVTESSRECSHPVLFVEICYHIVFIYFKV